MGTSRLPFYRMQAGCLRYLQATGDYARAKALLDRLVSLRPAVKTMLDRLGDVPVDFEPRFVLPE